MLNKKFRPSATLSQCKHTKIPVVTFLTTDDLLIQQKQEQYTQLVVIRMFSLGSLEKGCLRAENGAALDQCQRLFSNVSIWPDICCHLNAADHIHSGECSLV